MVLVLSPRPTRCFLLFALTSTFLTGQTSVTDTDALLYLPGRDISKLRLALQIPALSPRLAGLVPPTCSPPPEARGPPGPPSPRSPRQQTEHHRYTLTTSPARLRRTGHSHHAHAHRQ